MQDDKLRGRTERRFSIIVAVRLLPAQSVDTHEEEKTYTDNISPRGLRVFSRHPWETGEVLKLTSLHNGSICGQVVYCEKLQEDRYAVGLHILDRPIPWSVIDRFWDT